MKMVYALLFCALPAFADIGVGDYASFDVTVTKEDKVLLRSTETMIVDGFESDDVLLIRIIDKDEGQDERVSGMRSSISASYYSDAEMEDFLATCEENNGTIEEVTVPAGTFTSCKALDASGTTTWFGNVKFNRIKQSGPSADGSTYTMELSGQS